MRRTYLSVNVIMAALEKYSDKIEKLIYEKNASHNEVSLILKQKYHLNVGASARSVRRFCAENGISKRVRNCIRQVSSVF